MSVLQTCLRCPYFHPISEPCPPGWHEVRAKGGDGGGGRWDRAIGFVLGALFSLAVWALVAWLALR